MCLAQGPQRSDACEAGTRGPSVSSQALYHWATALPPNSLDPDQDRQNVMPDLGPNCLQKLSADDKRQEFTVILILSEREGQTFISN